MTGEEVKAILLSRGVGPTAVDIFLQFHKDRPEIWGLFKAAADESLKEGYAFLSPRDVMLFALGRQAEVEAKHKPMLKTLGILYAIVYEKLKGAPNLFEIEITNSNGEQANQL